MAQAPSVPPAAAATLRDLLAYTDDEIVQALRGWTTSSEMARLHDIIGTRVFDLLVNIPPDPTLTATADAPGPSQGPCPSDSDGSPPTHGTGTHSSWVMVMGMVGPAHRLLRPCLLAPHRSAGPVRPMASVVVTHRGSRLASLRGAASTRRGRAAMVGPSESACLRRPAISTALLTGHIPVCSVCTITMCRLGSNCSLRPRVLITWRSRATVRKSVPSALPSATASGFASVRS